MKRILVVVLILGIVGGVLGWSKYQDIYGANTSFDEDSRLFLIPTGSDFQFVLGELKNQNMLLDMESFEWVSERKSYPELVKPGRYRIQRGDSNNEIINRLRSGDQEPVNLTFNSIRTMDQLAGKLAQNVEPDSLTFLTLLKNSEVAAGYGFNHETFATMFLPNTYEVWWNSTAESVVQRMAEEYKRFWNDDRRSKASALGLSQSEVTILASIVASETTQLDEASRVTGVYANRLRIGMPLQADPTLVFALGDFSITRVLDHHKEINSPYNTYKYAGLPPGPIRIVSPAYIDAVLNAEKHDFLYFCAKPDFSGYHNFSKTYRQHLIYAREYHRALNNRGIMR